MDVKISWLNKHSTTADICMENNSATKILWLNKVKDICMDNDSAITDMCRSQDLYIKKTRQA